MSGKTTIIKEPLPNPPLAKGRVPQAGGVLYLLWVINRT